MADGSIPNSWNEIKRFGKSGTYDRAKTVRAYTYSPDCIALQIRTETGYATSVLTDAQARLVIQLMTDAINEHGKL